MAPAPIGCGRTRDLEEQVLSEHAELDGEHYAEQTESDQDDDQGSSSLHPSPSSEAALAYIRNRYGVPAHIGRHVKFEGLPATIVGGRDAYLILDFAGRVDGPYHPTWEIDYLDGRDYGAEYDERVREVNRVHRTM